MRGRAPGWRSTCAALALLALAGALGDLPAAKPGDHAMLAVFPPWWSQDRIWRAARGAGDIVGVGASPFVMALQPRGSDLVERARRAGALLLLDARGLGACGEASEGTAE